MVLLPTSRPKQAAAGRQQLLHLHEVDDGHGEGIAHWSLAAGEQQGLGVA